MRVIWLGLGLIAVSVGLVLLSVFLMKSDVTLVAGTGRFLGILAYSFSFGGILIGVFLVARGAIALAWRKYTGRRTDA